MSRIRRTRRRGQKINEREKENQKTRDVKDKKMEAIKWKMIMKVTSQVDLRPSLFAFCSLPY
jgi:hypothetical protein